MQIKSIAHCADIHIRKLHRFVEYREVFNRFYKQLAELKPDLIYIGGDIVHGKLDTSPEETRLVADFFLNLADVAKTIVIPGNHDTNLNNKSREDVLSPIIDLIKQINPNIEYWKQSGKYSIGNVDFGVLSIFDVDKEGVQIKTGLPDPKTMTGDHKIALFHGTVGNYEVDNGLIMSDDKIKVRDFDGYDIVMLGDIHKRQSLNEQGTIVYPGSLIQQNFSEDPSHGFVLWDLEKRQAEYHQVKNSYGYKTITVENGTIQNTMNFVPAKGHIRIRHTNTSVEQIKDIKLSLHKNYPYIKSIKTEKTDLQPTANVDRKVFIGDVRDVQYQEKLLREHLAANQISTEQTDRLVEINKFTNDSPDIVKADIARNINWKLKSLRFDNMFSYGENNFVNFENMDGVVGLVAPNHSGKSALIDSLAYAIFDMCSRTTRAVDVLNRRKKTFKITINLDVDGNDYYIERVGKYRKRVSKKHNKVTELCPVSVKFYMKDSGEIVDLTGAARKNTQYGAGTNENIKSLLGTFDDFCLTAMSLQSNGTNFIEKRQHERKTILSQFLDIGIFDQLHDIARKDVSEDRIMLKRLQDDKLYETLVHLDSKIQDITDNLDSTSKQHQNIQDSLNDNETKKIELLKRMYRIDDAIEDITQLETTLNSSTVDLKALMSELEDDLDYKENLRPLYNRYNDKLSSINEQDLTQNLTEYTKLYDEYTSLKTEQSILNNKKTTLLEKQTLLESYKYDPNCEYCITNGERQISEKQNTDTNLSEVKEQLDLIEVKTTKLNNIDNDLKAIQKENTKYNLLLEEINQIKQDSFKLANRITDKQGKITLLQTTISNTKNLIKQYNKNAKKIEKNKQLTDEIVQLDESILKLSTDLDSYNTNISTISKELHRLEIERETTNAAIKNMVSLEQKINDYELYLASISRDGIPFNLISTTIAAVEQEINDVLDNMMVGFVIKLEMDDSKNIMAKIQYNQESWPLELCSGMEKFVSSLAIRIGLINISTLPRPNFIIVDEGFGTLDSENIGNMKGAFEYLKTQFDFVLIVTHLDTIKDYMDYLIPIEVDNGYSKVYLN